MGFGDVMPYPSISHKWLNTWDIVMPITQNDMHSILQLGFMIGWVYDITIAQNGPTVRALGLQEPSKVAH